MMSAVHTLPKMPNEPRSSFAMNFTSELVSNIDGVGEEIANARNTKPPEESKVARTNGAIGENRKAVTMETIANAANISKGAISSILNDRGYGVHVSPKTRQRVFRICRELGYIPHDLRAMVRMYPDLGEICL